MELLEWKNHFVGGKNSCRKHRKYSDKYITILLIIFLCLAKCFGYGEEESVAGPYPLCRAELLKTMFPVEVNGSTEMKMKKSQVYALG